MNGGLGRDLADVQGLPDCRGVKVDQAGIRDLRYPITVLDPEHGKQHVTATVSMSVGLRDSLRGTHMSRFVEVLQQHRGEMTLRTLPTLLNDLKDRLDADTAQVRIDFPYFLQRAAPVSGAIAAMCYDCSFAATLDAGRYDFVLSTQVPVASLCPCSKAISDAGAHNQRGRVDIQVRSLPGQDGQPQIIWIEELVDVAEHCASSPLYSLLKRPDERYITMQAYANPAFVEDIARATALRLQDDGRVSWFQVFVVTLESIHNHNAFASVEWSRPV